MVKHGTTRQYIKFVKTNLINQIWLEAKISQGVPKFYSFTGKHIQHVISPAVILILALKNQLFDDISKVQRPIFQQSEV